ncbi:MAG: hypothetical protein A3G21_07450 [Acidobacteria bacterium RIFCSPLOWO2_12_FULL_66_21]|nr:MAG: hypothetical protein A3G21_07450 [Acidobacteria bacterium RIFCSPLOWO2_12_FULL_66_21]
MRIGYVMNPLGVARRMRGLSLAEIANTTRLSPRHLEAIDEGRFADLPVGIYARSYVRAFADAVGLDTAELAAILPLLPTEEDPLPAAARARAAVAARAERVPRTRVPAAAGLDLLLLFILNAVIVRVVAMTCGIGAGALLTHTPLPLIVLCATTWVLYFILLAGVHGRTMGQVVCGVPDRRPECPLRLRVILLRAVNAWAPAD